MALLDHDNKKQTGKKLLSRGPKIEVNSQVKRSDIDRRVEKNITNEKNKNISTSVMTTVTEPVNIRVDNHIRNQIAALITMGHSDTQKEMVDYLLNQYVDTLDKNDYKRFEDLVDIYEEKDLMKHNRKMSKRK